MWHIPIFREQFGPTCQFWLHFFQSHKTRSRKHSKLLNRTFWEDCRRGSDLGRWFLGGCGCRCWATCCPLEVQVWETSQNWLDSAELRKGGNRKPCSLLWLYCIVLRASDSEVINIFECSCALHHWESDGVRQIQWQWDARETRLRIQNKNVACYNSPSKGGWESDLDTGS